MENRIENLLCLQVITGFKPRLKKAAVRLDELRRPAGDPLPPQLLEELEAGRWAVLIACSVSSSGRSRRLANRRRWWRNRSRGAADPVWTRPVGLDQYATGLTREVFCRSFADRRAIAGFVGLTGTPFNSGGSEHEQGISKNGNPRVRRILLQLAWRWLRFQPDSALSCWFLERTGGAKGRIRKVMAVALARKLLVALWRYIETGELPAGARLAAAA